MNKAVIIRASLILGTFLIIILIAVGCEFIFNKDQEVPTIDNPDGIFLSLDDGITITNQELWEAMRNTDGVSYLEQYVDYILLADYTGDAISQDEVDAYVSRLKYLTEDPEVVARIQANPDVNEEYINVFNQRLGVLGYNPFDPASLKEYVELDIAKSNYLKAQILSATEGDALFITDEALQSYYDENTYGDSCVVDLRFSSSTEASMVLEHFNLVYTYTNEDELTGLGLYSGTEPIEDVARADFDDTNTTLLTNDEVFEYYLQMYNYIYPWLDPIVLTSTTPADRQAEYCTNYSDESTRNYNDLTEYRETTDPIFVYANYAFNTLDLDNEGITPFTYTTSKAIGDFIYMVYKVSQDSVTAFEDLTQTELDAVLDDLLLEVVNDQAIGNLMSDLYEEGDYEVFDPFLKIVYEYTDDKPFDNEGSTTLVATIGDEEITAQELFDFMANRVGIFYAFEAAKTEITINSDDYVSLYGESRDYLNSKATTMIEHRDALRLVKTNFTQSEYAASMSWDDFLLLAFNAPTEADVIESYYIIQELDLGLILDTIGYSQYQAYMQDQITTYFSLNVDHLLIFLDRDMDFVPDSFNDYIDSLDSIGEAEYNTLRGDFEDLIKAQLLLDKTFPTIVSEFENSLIDDTENIWAPYKEYGFYIKTEELGEIDQTYLQSLDPDFAASLKRIYTLYNLPENIENDEYIDDQVTVSDFGVHFLTATKGTAFEMPTAYFQYEDGATPSYSEGSENDQIIPSEAQIAIYLEIKADEDAGNVSTKMLPTSVYQAVEYYFGPVFDAYTNQTGFVILIGNYMVDHNVEFTVNDADRQTELQDILDILYKANFPDKFVAYPTS